MPWNFYPICLILPNGALTTPNNAMGVLKMNQLGKTTAFLLLALLSLLVQPLPSITQIRGPFLDGDDGLGLLPSSPRAISSCMSIRQSGSYVLTTTLTRSGTEPCLIIEVANVHIDFAGHGLIHSDFPGPSPPGSTGITASAQSNRITIRDGFITGFSVGIDLRANAQVLITGMRLHYLGAAARVGSNSQVLENSIIYCSQGVIAGPSSRIFANALFSITLDGIIIFSFSEGSATGGASEIYGNTLLGVRSPGIGINSTEGFPAYIHDNQVSQFTVGIYAPNDSIVSRNLVTDNSWHGVRAGSRSVVDHNATLENGQAGIVLDGEDAVAVSNFVARNGSFPSTNVPLHCTAGQQSGAVDNIFSGNFRNDTTCREDSVIYAF
jgi:hypothetical protein